MTEQEIKEKRALEYIRTVDRNPWIPKLETLLPDGSIHRGPFQKQRVFLLLGDILEVLYGGAGAGGKSFSLMMAAAQYVHVHGYSALLFRQNYGDLIHPQDGLISISKRWWGDLKVGKQKAEYLDKNRAWTFPSGATIQFGYLEHYDQVENYRGGSRQFIGWDEMTQYEERMYRFFFGWLRKPSSGPLSEVPLRMRGASNPGGKGHEWVKRMFVDPKTREPGTVFVPATRRDNLAVDEESYRLSAARMDPILRKQVEEGDWDAHSGGRFLPEWFKNRWDHGHGPDEYRLFTSSGVRTVHRRSLRGVFQTVDPAASEKTTADWTVISTWALTQENELLWLDMDRFQHQIPDIPARVLSAYRKHRADYVAIEAVGANSAVAQMCARLPMIVQGIHPGGKDKLARATPATIFAQEGRLLIPFHAPWLETATSELFRFTGTDEDAHDDIVDTVSMACQCLQRNMHKMTGTQSSLKPYIPFVHPTKF